MLRERIDKHLEAFVADRSQLLAEITEPVTELSTAIADLTRGGKRLRASFCYWGFRGTGAEDGAGIIAAASALELFQSAALIHDDLMDDSDTRRGMPALHRRFAALHREHGWSGDADRFGMAAALLAGDLCLSWSEELFNGCGLPAADLARGRTAFDRMRTQLMGGQYLDVLEQARGTGGAGSGDGDDTAAARRVIEFKSSRYTVVEPLQIGAALGGADEMLLAGLRAFGAPLGEAFQLRDDLLGVFGDAAVTGKPAGDDLREGKRTVLIALTRELTDAAGLATVDRLLGDRDLDAAGVEALREVIRASGAVDRLEALIATRVLHSREALADLTEQGFDAEAGATLASLITIATERSA